MNPGFCREQIRMCMKRMAGIILRHRFRHMTALYCAGQKTGRSSTGRGSDHLEKHESGPMSKHIWAPELHYLEGNGTSILPVVKKRISGKSVHMCWNVRGRTHWQMHGWKKAKCSVQMGMNSRLKHSPWTQPYLRMPEIITTCGQKRLE